MENSLTYTTVSYTHLDVYKRQPRTDSRYLTSDMAESLPVLVNLVAKAMPFRKGIAISCDAGAVINDKKVTDHHAVIPTRNLQGADLSGLPVGEKAELELVALRLLCAVAQPYTFAETAVVVECAGAEFTACLLYTSRRKPSKRARLSCATKRAF